jgi:FMN phosphatase YigB (HAD superfamily)
MDTPELDHRRDELRCMGLQENLAKMGVEISFEDLEDGLRASTPWLADIWKKGGQVSTIEQIRYIVNHATRNRPILLTDPEVLIKLEESYWSPSLTAPATLNAEAPEVLHQLRERNMRIGLICNTGRGPGHALRELMRREGILDHFDATVFSDEIGYGKPDLRLFLMAAERLGLKPSDLLHVGDNIENDVGGAQRAGMKALLFDYGVPSGFRTQQSLLALTRASDSNTTIIPDGRIKSLRELLNFID